MKFLNYIFVSFFSLLGLSTSAQIPTDVPKPQDNSPVDFSKPVNIIIFIVLPILIVVLVLIWRNKNRKDQSEKQ